LLRSGINGLKKFKFFQKNNASENVLFISQDFADLSDTFGATLM
jgi:hypothetical protein